MIMKDVFKKLVIILCCLFSKVVSAQVLIDSIDATSVLCNGGTTGSLQIFASNGTPPYTYSLNGSTQSTSNAFVNLAAGAYTVIVTDINNITALSTQVITQPQPLTISAVAGSILCSGGTTNVILSITGGTGVVSTSPSNFGLLAATYTFQAVDANGCSNSVSVTVAPGPSPITTTTSITGCGFGNYTVCPTSAGGTPPYSYNYFPGNVVSNGCSILNPSNAVIYTLTTTDVNGCTSFNLVLLNTTNSTLQINTTQPSCANPSNSICAIVNGSSSYTYSIDSGTYQASNCFTNLSIGTHTILVKDSTGCINASTKTLYFSDTISVSGYKIVDSSCLGGLSKATVSYGGGTPPYTVNWSTNPIQTTDTIFNVQQGNYICNVVDANGCSGNAMVNFSGNSQWGLTSQSICEKQLAYSAIYDNSPYNGANGFSILPTIGTISNGNGYLFNPSSTTIYTVTASSNLYGCQSTATVTITVKEIVNAINSIRTNPNCTNSSDGNIVVNVSPANNNLLYTYNNVLDGAIHLNLSPGNYYIVVTDTITNGCIILRDTLVSQGINCGNIIGKVSLDVNNNCIAESSEPSIANQKIVLNPSGQITYTNSNGAYAFNGVSYGTYSVVNTNNLLGYGIACNTSVSSVINASSPINTVNFLDTLSGNLDYSIYSWNNCLNFSLSNTSSLIYSGHNANTLLPSTVFAVFNGINKYASSFPTHSSINGDTVFWNITSIGFNSIIVNFNITSTTPVGTLFSMQCGVVNTIGTDPYTTNNFVSTSNFICNSFDPNDKQVSPQGALAQGYIPVADSVLNYNINFQNTGTAPAVNVLIIDTISNAMDLNSLKVITASHNYFVDIVGNVIKFRFPLIMLPDSNANEPASHGNIAYTLKMKPTTSVGSVIKNTANIYFDYNAPIVTNTTTNTIYDDLLQNSPTINRNTSCNTPCGNGSILLNPVGGVPPFTHVILPNCNATTIINNAINNLAGGNYSITTTDAIGNVTTLSIPVLNPIPIILNLSTVQPVGQLGSASVAPIGGTPPYDYLWLPGSFTTATINNLLAGNYNVSVLDANGCSQGSAFVLNYPLAIPDVALGEFVNCYPNPTKNALQIVANFDLQKVIVFNASGQILIQQECSKLQQTSIDLQGLAAGMYYVQMGKGVIRKVYKE
jgi:Secretion system C-terminal sorting domain/SprB repeat